LRAFIGPEQIGLVRLPEEPHLLRLRGPRAYVAGRSTLSVADLDSLRVQATIALDHADSLSELSFSADGSRAFGLYEGSSRLSVFELRPPRLVGSVTTGRGGVKFAKALGAVALVAAASLAEAHARAQGRLVPYDVSSIGIAAPESSVVVRPDGRVAFALNTQSNDVTVVNAERATVLSKQAAKGRTLAAFPNGRRFAVLGKDKLRLFDMQTQRPGQELEFEDAQTVSLIFTADEKTALAFGGKTLYLLDAETGRVRSQVPGLLSVGSILFDGGPSR
jgi:DNA-binding beta-propeller fold protein YncE